MNVKEAEAEFERLLTESNRQYAHFQGPADPRQWDATYEAKEQVLAPLKQATVLCNTIMLERTTLISANREPITSDAEIQAIVDGFEIMRWVVLTKISSIERTDPPKLDERLRRSKLIPSSQESLHLRWGKKQG